MHQYKLGDAVATKYGNGKVTLLPTPQADGVQRVHVTCDNKSCYDFHPDELTPILPEAAAETGHQAAAETGLIHPATSALEPASAAT